MNTLITDFERHIKLGPTFAARLLGYAYPTYAQYRSGRRPLQLYARRHIQAVMLLPPPALDMLIREHVFDGNR